MSVFKAGLCALTLSWLILYTHECTDQGGSARIVEDPETQHVLQGGMAAFYCNICAADHAYWTINGTTLDSKHPGIITAENVSEELNTYNLRIIIPALYNTSVQCRASGSDHQLKRSDTAHLIVLTSTYIQQPTNPFVENINSTYWRIEWDPIGPDYPILVYNITIINITMPEEHALQSIMVDSQMNHYMVNLNNYGGLSCSIIEFSISAVGIFENAVSEPTRVIQEFPIEPQSFVSSAVATEVYFTPNGIPILKVQVVLPMVCNFQHINYSIIVEDNSGAITPFGPWEHVGPGTVEMIINSNRRALIRNTQYSVMVEVGSTLGIVSSQKYAIDTHLDVATETQDSTCKNAGQTGLYITVMGVCIGLCVLFLLVILVLLVCICLRRKRHNVEKTGSTDKARSNMVDNPIYDGPVYESIRQDFNTLPTTSAPSTVTTETNGNVTCGVASASTPDNETPHVRYLQQPVHSSKNNTTHCNNNTRSNTISLSTPGNTIPECDRSVSVSDHSSKIKMGSTKSSRERNKLHLTLSLDTQNSTSATPTPAAVLIMARHRAASVGAGNRSQVSIGESYGVTRCPSIATNSMSSLSSVARLGSNDDNYTVMSPVGSVAKISSGLVGGWGELSPEDTAKYREDCTQ